MKQTIRIATVWIAAALLLAAAPEQLELKALAHQLAGTPLQRAEARQMLPRYGADAVPLVLPYVTHEQQEVWRAAARVLEDIANETAAPGADEEARREVAAQLAALVEPGRSEHAVRHGLRLLPLAIPEGYPVTALSRRLDEPAWREKARAALVKTGTARARAALRGALRHASGPDYVVALIHGLDHLNDPHAYALFEERLADDDAGVRAAAALALAASGDVAHLDAYKEVVRRAGAATRFDAMQAVVLLANAALGQGGQYEPAMAAHRWVLAHADDPVLKSAAIAGMASAGDDRAVPHIMNALRDEPALAGAVAEAFRSLKGRAAHAAMKAAYPELPPPLRPGALRAFGETGDAIFMPVFQQALASDDAAAQAAAAEALASTGHPEAAAALADYARAQQGEVRSASLRRLMELATGLVAQGHEGAAGEAYLAVFQLAEDGERKDAALEGLVAHPTPEAFEVLRQNLDEGALETLPVPTLAGVASAMEAAGETGMAKRVLDMVLERATSPADVQAVYAAAQGAPAAGRIVEALGFIQHWKLIGPWPWSQEDGFGQPPFAPSQVDLAATYEVQDETLAWRDVELPGPQVIVNLMELIGPHTSAIAYAYTRVNVPQGGRGALRLGSDDGVQAWVNGEVVHSHPTDRGAAIDQDHAEIPLEAGENDILLAISQNGGGWNFIARLAEIDGKGLAFEDALPAQEGPR